jgi:acyl-CoA synthetase (AMP-forming)/AMP-acid ligase II
MIISGGVNIHPQEIENELIVHPKVDDVAVIGVPHAEFGEEVKAVVQPVAGVEGDGALAEELIAYARECCRRTSARAPSTSSASSRASPPESSTSGC